MVILDKSLERKMHWQRDIMEGEARTGLARLDMGLSTVIGKENMDSSRNKINPSMLPTLNRLTWDFRTKLNNSSDRSLKAAFSELDSLKDKLGLSDVIIQRTTYIYRKAQEKGMLRGRSISHRRLLYEKTNDYGLSASKDEVRIGLILFFLQ